MDLIDDFPDPERPISNNFFPLDMLSRFGFSFYSFSLISERYMAGTDALRCLFFSISIPPRAERPRCSAGLREDCQAGPIQSLSSAKICEKTPGIFLSIGPATFRLPPQSLELMF